MNNRPIIYSLKLHRYTVIHILFPLHFLRKQRSYIEEGNLFSIRGRKVMIKYPVVKKGLAIGIILVFISTLVIPSIALDIETPLPTSRGTWLYVGGSGPGNYSSITAALQNASDNDTIYVYSGLYSEDTLKINISVSFIGQSNITTIIDYSIFIFNTKNIFLTEFSFQNHSEIIIASQNGNNVSHNTVTNTIFTNNSSGIMIGNSSYNMIINNRFDKCGIFLSPLFDLFLPSTEIDDITNTIRNNTVNGKPLVYLEDVNNRSISDAGEIILLRCMNITISQISFGIGSSLLEFIKTTDTKVTNNDFNNTILFFINSSENTIADNRFYTPYGEYHTNGLLLFDHCCNNDITHNIFSYQSLITIFMSSNNSFERNDFYRSLHFQPFIIFINADNTWQRNFWMRPRILPKIIFGAYYIPSDSKKTRTSFDVDWRPTLIPNNPIPNWIYNEQCIQQRTGQSWFQVDWMFYRDPLLPKK